MLNQIANFFLLFSHDTVIIPLVIIGFIWINRNIFYHAICLILLSMLFSAALKVSFQKISPYGFCFPSGHMQAAVVLYGWLAYKFENRFLRIGTLILLSGIGISLVYLNYHDCYDVLGGIFFAVIFLWGYIFALRETRHSMMWVSLSLATCLMLYIYLRYGQILPHLWLAYYALIGFIFSVKIFAQKIDLKNIAHKILATILCFLIILITHSIFQSQFLFSLPAYLYQMKWLLIGISIPCSNFTSNVIIEIVTNKHH